MSMLKRSVPVTSLFSVLLFGGPAFAEDAVVCADIESAIERLDCYDRQHRERQARAAEAPRSPARPRPTYQTRPSEATRPEAVRPSEPSPAAPAARAEPPPREAAPPAEKKGGLFSWNRKVDFESEIAALRRGDQQRMVFRLENGQIWMQNTPRDLPFSVGDQVTIKSGRLGGYVMRSSRGTSTRVRKLE